ncbi:hypothetical protein ARMGADRAFT_460580 [Armillaria gallica]|uniref:Uncharacterized protein n=1 Tax=Armillaria gallica TaxID=47427 RepID=A0A2H3DEQ1_ARMGA|nr:hypothetical protein ARMGADRAFT_460580 [Armillaria gallica]
MQLAYPLPHLVYVWASFFIARKRLLLFSGANLMAPIARIVAVAARCCVSPRTRQHALHKTSNLPTMRDNQFPSPSTTCTPSSVRTSPSFIDTTTPVHSNYPHYDKSKQEATPRTQQHRHSPVERYPPGLGPCFPSNSQVTV